MYELSLGLALSKSLADEKGNGVETLSSDDAPAGGPTTLENFGFTNTRNHPLGVGNEKYTFSKLSSESYREKEETNFLLMIQEKRVPGLVGRFILH